MPYQPKEEVKNYYTLEKILSKKLPELVKSIRKAYESEQPNDIVETTTIGWLRDYTNMVIQSKERGISMYQPKVSNAQKYEDSQVNCVVVPAKLIFVKADKDEEHKDYVSSNQKEGFGELEKPILISETEEIEIGDTIYNSHTGDILKGWTNDHVNDWWYKVLALPEYFSDKHLQAIVDGKMEEGEVLVKCEVMEEPVTDGQWRKYTEYKIHLDQQNRVTLFPAKQSVQQGVDNYISDKYLGDNSKYNGEEIIIYHAERAFKAGAEWAKKNNY